MASEVVATQLPNIPVGFVKDGVLVVDNRIGGMPGPLLEPQHRQWVPDERDAFISWLRGEFAAANAMIDALCHHVQMTGKPGEYDFVLTCIQQRRYNWTVVLHMQQYFSVAEVVFALQQVVWQKKQGMNPDAVNVPPPYGSAENGGGGYTWKEHANWKEQTNVTNVYRDAREPLIQGGYGYPPSVGQEEVYGKKEILEIARKPEDHGYWRGTVVHEQLQEPVAANMDTGVYSNGATGNASERNDSASIRRVETLELKGSTSLISTPQEGVASEQKESDQETPEQAAVDDTIVNVVQTEEATPISCFKILSKEEDEKRFAAARATKTYTCTELVDGKMVNIVDGLELYDTVLETLESSKLATLIQELQMAGKRGELGGIAGFKKSGRGKGRELIQFGSLHSLLPEDNKRRTQTGIGLDADTPNAHDVARPLPEFLQDIIDRLVRWSIIPASKRPDCCTINIIDEGDYIPPHVNNFQLERPICILTLQSDCTMIFGQSLTVDTPGSFKGPFQIALPVGSILLLQRNSSDLAKHAIPASSSKRISLTFGKSSRTSKSTSSPPPGGISRSPPLPGAVGNTSSWGTSHNNGGNNRQASNAASHGSSGRGGGGYGSGFKSHTYTPASSGVLPVPAVRPAQLNTNVPASSSQFTGISGASTAQYPHPPPALVVPPSWSPMPRAPPPARPPSAGTGVFFPAGGSSTGPGRPTPPPGQRKTGGSAPTSPPLLQKTTSAPGSLASLDVSPGSTPRTPKSSKSASGSSEKVTPRVSPTSPETRDVVTLGGKQSFQEPAGSGQRSDTGNGIKVAKEENVLRTQGRLKVLTGSKTNMVSIGSHS